MGELVMRNKSLLWILLMGTICLSGSVSCQKEMVGKQIHFKASTRPKAQQTKTSYSGETAEDNSKTYERIDWVNGDKILLAMTNAEQTTPATQVYQITGITSSGRYSTAGLQPEAPASSGLQWGTGTHDFWAAYPSTATVGDHSFSFPIPAAQLASYVETNNGVIRFAPDMGKAFMVAGFQSSPTDAGINLDFYHGFTAFEFTVGADDDITVTSFEMETETYETETSTIVPICGTAVATFDSSNSMSYAFSTAPSPSPGQTITVTFDNNPSISSTASMNFKVFALPQDLTGIVIRFYLSNGIQHSLKLKQSNAWLTFSAGVKYNISGLLVPGAAWYINFDGPSEEEWITTHPNIEIGVE